MTGSTVRKPGDVIVTTQITGGQNAQPVDVAWRVLGGSGAWKAVDVQFKGVWLAITQQQLAGRLGISKSISSWIDRWPSTL